MSAPAFDAPLRACPVCAGGPLADFDRDHAGRSIVRCRACDLLVMSPQYSDAWLAEFYARYIAVHDQDRTDHKKGSLMDPEMRREAKRRALAQLRAAGASGRLLCIGCGDGMELVVARELGFQPEGYDVDPATTREVANRCGVPVHHGAFADLPLAAGSFDAVFFDNVLEHLKTPSVYLRKIHALLRPGGLAYVGVPNVGSISCRWKTLVGKLGLRPRRRGSHYSTKHHILYFTPATLRRTLEQVAGLQVLLLRGSLKPQGHALTRQLSHWLPSLDSSIFAIARK